jgi:hypothetical protein
MPSERSSASDIANAAMRLFPPKVRTSVLADVELRRRFAFRVDAEVRFSLTGAEFVRSTLFAAIRRVLGGNESMADVHSKAGVAWQVRREKPFGVAIRHGNVGVVLQECACMSPEAHSRLEWFDQERAKLRVADQCLTAWREILACRPVEDEELGELLKAFRLVPAHVAASIGELFRRGSFEGSDLVPSELLYFDRLVGEPGTDAGVEEFIFGTVGPHITGLLENHGVEGMKSALLLSSHSRIVDLIDPVGFSADAISQVFEWVAVHGDVVSQAGAVECGLRLLEQFPRIESSLATMAGRIVADNPDELDGRLHLFSCLVIFVESELGRTRIARRRPPYWRRLASIAHASLIQREAIAANLDSARLAEWAISTGGRLYYTQTLTDLRLEPRWLPDLVSAQQFRAELIGRIATAAERHRKNVKDGQLASVLFGTELPSIQSQRNFPYAFLPGPLEGGVEAVTQIPPELETNIRAELEAAELTPTSFAGLVNSSLIFRVGPELSGLAVQGLRRVGYQLRKTSSNQDPFPLLHGLAKVAAVTRSTELAQEVRILARGARRKGVRQISPESIAIVALVACAAAKDAVAWSTFVGDWLTELAFLEMTRNEALALQAEFYRLLHLEPHLWETCGRAEAAIAAFISSFPDFQSDGGRERPPAKD